MDVMESNDTLRLMLEIYKVTSKQEPDRYTKFCMRPMVSRLFNLSFQSLFSMAQYIVRKNRVSVVVEMRVSLFDDWPKLSVQNGWIQIRANRRITCTEFGRGSVDLKESDGLRESDELRERRPKCAKFGFTRQPRGIDNDSYSHLEKNHSSVVTDLVHGSFQSAEIISTPSSNMDTMLLIWSFLPSTLYKQEKHCQQNE